MRPRRPVEEMSMSFLDVICCGFGAVILLLMTTKFIPPMVLETIIDAPRWNRRGATGRAVQIRGETDKLTRELSDGQRELDTELQSLAQLERELSTVLGRYQTSKSEAEEAVITEKKLAQAKQSLTRRDGTSAGRGLPARRQHRRRHRGRQRIRRVRHRHVGKHVQLRVADGDPQAQRNTAIYPALKGIQVMSDQGEYMFPQYGGRWIPDSPARRRAILERMRSFNPFSVSCPIVGIEKAIRAFQAPDKRISVYVFGDDFTGRSIEEVVDTVDRINAPDANGGRRRCASTPSASHTCSGWPPPASLYRYAALMRELAYRNGGTFVGLDSG